MDTLCGSCNECTEQDYCSDCESFKCECACNLEKDRLDFLVNNGLNPDRCDWIVDIPHHPSGEFYIKFERLGNKHFISAKKTDLFIQWAKLTQELFR